MRMRRVLFCSQTAAAVGGVPQRLGPLTRSLPQLGWEPIVALAWGNRFHDPEAFKRQHPGLPTTMLDGRTGTRAGRLVALEKTIRSVEPDVVVPLHLFDALEAVRREKATGRDIRLVFGVFEVSPALLLDAERYRPVIDYFVTNSRLLSDLFVGAAGADRARVENIPQGIPPAASLRTHGDGPIQIGYFGRISEDKRILDLLPFCAELDARRVAFRVLVIGDGPLTQALESGSEPWRRRGVFEIRPAETRQQLYNGAYPSIDVSVLFSPREGAPNLPLESMAHGVVPVVADFEGRHQEGALRHEENVLVFPVGDVVRAAGCVERLWREPETRRRLGSKGVEEVAHRYGLENMAAAWARVLDRAIERPSANGSVSLDPVPPSGRLERWLGPRASETLRRLLGRRFVHPDAGEWPFWGGWGDAEVGRMKSRVEAIVAEWRA